MGEQHTMKWNAFMMAHNEETEIEQTIQHIRNQSIPPNKILVLDDGSTDSTGAILDSMSDVEVKHVAPHPSHIGSVAMRERQSNLMIQASKDTDYVVSVDADTTLLPEYMERITHRMRQDNVMVACGTDSSEPRIISAESGMVADANWFRTATPPFPSAVIVAYAVLDGYQSAVYRDIKLVYRRKTGTNYSKAQYMDRGAIKRRYGYPMLVVLYDTLTTRSFSVLQGYITSREEPESESVRKWFRRFCYARMREKIGLRTDMFKRTSTGVYILPAPN